MGKLITQKEDTPSSKRLENIWTEGWTEQSTIRCTNLKEKTHCDLRINHFTLGQVI